MTLRKAKKGNSSLFVVFRKRGGVEIGTMETRGLESKSAFGEEPKDVLVSLLDC